MKSQDFKSIVKCTPTRFSADGVTLYIGKIAPAHWQCVVEQDGDMRQTGAFSKTKLEAFSILPDVARSWGFEV